MEKNNESQYHKIAVCIKSILGALAETEKTFLKFAEAFANQEGLNLNSQEEIGFMNAKDVFMIALNCNDCNKLKDNINIIMKLIKKEERTFNNIVTVLTEFIEKNENNCQNFLNNQDITEICSHCEDIFEEDEN